MDALRIVTCARSACRQLFFLCSHCDRGHRYCGPDCRDIARRSCLREAGRRYQTTRSGRHAHAERQRRYRERQQKVTHQTDEEVPVAATVPPAPTEVAMPAESSSGAAREGCDAKPEGKYRCAWCERESRFLRHQTLAKYRPRWRRPP